MSTAYSQESLVEAEGRAELKRAQDERKAESVAANAPMSLMARYFLVKTHLEKQHRFEKHVDKNDNVSG